MLLTASGSLTIRYDFVGNVDPVCKCYTLTKSTSLMKSNEWRSELGIQVMIIELTENLPIWCLRVVPSISTTDAQKW